MLAGCAGASAPAEAPAGPPAAPDELHPRPKRRVEVVAAPPRFTDPKRRQTLESALPAIDAYLQQTIERDELVGLAAGVVIDGELVWARGYGMRDPARGLPVESDTAFRIGSITKPVTAMAVLLLRDRGQLELDVPAQEYLPALAGVVYSTTDSPAITIRHLLTHASGLPRMGNFPEYPDAPLTRAAFLASLQGIRLDRPPGIEYTYSNLGVQILGPLIDEVTGEDHRSFIRREILEPVGMHGAGWTPAEIGIERLALPHELDEHGKPRLRPHWTPGAADAAGGLYASVEDLAAFAAVNLAAWPAGGSGDTGPLAAATLREAHAVAVLRDFRAASAPPGEPATARVLGRGLGFGVYATCRYPHVVAHGGKTLGYRASLHMLPRHGVAVILLSNHSSISSAVLPRDGEAVLDLLHDTGALEPRQPVPAPALLEGGRSLARLFERWSPEGYAQSFSPDFRDSNPSTKMEPLLDRWRTLLGGCEGARVLETEEAYAGKLELVCERGGLQVSLRVAPWDGHPISSLRILGAVDLPPPEGVDEAARRAVALLEHWSDEAFARSFASRHHGESMRNFLSAVGQAVGRCELSQPRWIHPDGATYRLRCDRGQADMRLGLDRDQGTIGSFEIRDGTEGRCR